MLLSKQRITMNTQEREQLTRFLQQLTGTQAAQKDSEADALIREACLRQPDAAYLLVQRAMLLGHAVEDAQTQITRLQAELPQAQSRGNNSAFLDPNAWGSAGAARNNPATQMPAPSPTPAAAAPAPSAWGSGMLGNIATTAAGVVAGGFLFQGISHLMGNQGSHAATQGAMNSLSGNADAPASTPHREELADTSGVFDTSSVDNFINDDAGSSDELG
jgi:hypothetical protein